jgi:hypothetical protein
MTSLWIRRFGIVIAAAALYAAAVGQVSGSQSSMKKSFNQMRYYGGPKSPMWRG